MHNPMFVSQVAQGAWHAWLLCRLLMADLRAARQAPRAAADTTSADDAVALTDGDAVELTE